MPLTDAKKAEAIGAVIGSLRLRCMMGRSPTGAEIGPIADIVFQGCDEADTANKQLKPPPPLTHEGLTFYVNVKLAAAPNYAGLVAFIPAFWLMLVLRIIISILIEFWLTSREAA